MQNCDLTHSGIILSQSPGIGGLFTKVRTATLEWDKTQCGDATNCSYCWTAGKPTARPPDLNQLFKEHFPASLGPETKLFSCTSSQVGRILHSAGCQGINPNSAIHTALVSWTAKWVTDSLWCWEFGAVEKSNWLFGPWKRKHSNRTLVNGPWVWMKTSVTWATRALFFFRHGNMKHQRERTSGTECLIVS